MDVVYALVDCTAFYCSCERVFEPALWTRPVAVLSNNDGCIIARSREVKAAGVPMGAPLFEWRRRLQAIGAEVRSSNYTLYADMSRRVMQELEAMAIDVERYSIDEAFLTLPDLGHEDLGALGRAIRRRIKKRQGIPVRVGIGPTKTLAKVADEQAKEMLNAGTGEGVYVCPSEPALSDVLAGVDVGNVWGIGSASVQTLARVQVTTAEGFRRLPDAWIRREMTVTGLRTAEELRGQSCLGLQVEPPVRKSLIRSRSFGEPASDVAVISEAVARHTQRAAEKLRGDGLVARGLQVFITTKRFGPPPHLSRSGGGRLEAHTAHTPTLVAMARRIAQAIHIADVHGTPVRYKKAGVMLFDLMPARQRQRSVFDDPFDDSEADAALMDAVDALNEAMGRGTVGVAAAGVKGRRASAMTQQHVSPRYTTRWDELPRVQA